jgi:flagellar assembly factor FliW
MVKLDTRAFGHIEIEDDKVIRFEHGILGFPDLKEFTIIFDEDKGVDTPIKWLQSLDEPGFAMPVMNPALVMNGYTPHIDRELLTPLGDNIASDNLLILVTVTVPRDITKTTVNLKAPIIISIDNRKAVQLICDEDDYDVKHSIYDKIMAVKV